MGRTLRNFENKPLTQNNDIVGVYNTRTNTLEQRTDYYPYGLPHASISSEAAGAEVNRRKFGGKELMSDHGYNSYDFAARHQNPAFPHFTTPDPLLEKYYPISPFAYCAGDPINLIDPTGMDFWYINLMGEVINRIEDKDNDKIIIVDTKEKNHEKTDKIVAEVSFDYGTIERSQTISREDGTIDIFQIRGDDNGKLAFEFLSNFFQGNERGIEFSLAQCGKEKSGPNFITTSHENGEENGILSLINKQLKYGYSVRNLIHNHPNNVPFPSKTKDDKNNITGDIGFASQCERVFRKTINFSIYVPKSKNYFPFTSKSELKDYQ